MKPIRMQLTHKFKEAFKKLGYLEKFAEVNLSDRQDLAHFQCNGALAVSKSLKLNPRECAENIIKNLQLGESLEKGIELSIAGPGFINIKLSMQTLAEQVDPLLNQKKLGVDVTEENKKIIVDYGGPNVAKAMHVGHLRSLIIGDSLKKIHQYLNQEVVGDNHIGDWGTPMGMILADIQGNTDSITMDDLERIYPEAAAKFKTDEAFKKRALEMTDLLQKGDPQLTTQWKHFVQVTRDTLQVQLDRLKIVFDTWYGESFYEHLMPQMVEKLKLAHHTQESDGALVIVLADEQSPNMPPLILIKSGGGYLYHTSDLATVEHRVDVLKADQVLYVVDKRQSLHFEQVFKAAKITGIAKNTDLVHVGFGTMNGKDGKPFKTREGGVLKLKDFIDNVYQVALERVEEVQALQNTSTAMSLQEKQEIAEKVALATIKYADLKNNRISDYIFDLDKFSKFEGNTGPYLLYACVRIRSILRKAEESGILLSPTASVLAPTQTSEINLCLTLLKWNDAVQRAASLSEPHHIADYGFELSQSYNTFYNDCHILGQKDLQRQQSWLKLSALTVAILQQSLELLGIEVPKRM